jgi:hypothetical protein
VFVCSLSQEPAEKLHNEELHNLYSSPDIIRINILIRVSWEGHVACMGEKRRACKVFVEKLEASSRPRWEYNIVT